MARYVMKNIISYPVRLVRVCGSHTVLDDQPLSGEGLKINDCFATCSEIPMLARIVIKWSV